MAACLQAIVRGMFEDLRGYKLSYIAVQIKVRSTLQNKWKPYSYQLIQKKIAFAILTCERKTAHLQSLGKQY